MFTINDLLDLTKLESGQLTGFNDLFDLPALIREAVAPYQKDALRKGLTFDIITRESPKSVMGDPRKIASVISNLTANAGECFGVRCCQNAEANHSALSVKFTDAGGIVIECKPFQEPDGLRERDNTPTTKEVAVEIVVADTGCGIPACKLEELFRQFEQVEGGGQKGPFGDTGRPSGLGMSSVR